MVEIIQFPLSRINKKPNQDTVKSSNSSSNILEFKKNTPTEVTTERIKAFFSEGSPKIVVGEDIVVEVFGKKYKGIISKVLERDKSNNITKILYMIPFLNGDDPFKFGEADFYYIIKKHD